MGPTNDKIPNETFDYKTWKISPKGFDKDYMKFNDNPEQYRMWASRIRDHLISGHQSWGRLLDLVEKMRVQ